MALPTTVEQIPLLEYGDQSDAESQEHQSTKITPPSPHSSQFTTFNSSIVASPNIFHNGLPFSIFKGPKPASTAPTIAYDREDKSGNLLRRLHIEIRYKVSLKALQLSRRRACDSLPFFPLFAKLPVEVRLKIWSYASPRPYTHIQMPFEMPWPYQDQLFFPDERVGFTWAAPTPALLHTCRESRNEFLYLTHSTLNQLDPKPHPLFGLVFQDFYGRYSFFSWEQDTMLIVWPEEVSPIMHALRRIAMWGFHSKFCKLSPEEIEQFGVAWWLECLYAKFPNVEVFTWFYPDLYVTPCWLAEKQDRIEGLIARYRKIQMAKGNQIRSPIIRFAHRNEEPLSMASKEKGRRYSRIPGYTECGRFIFQ